MAAFSAGKSWGGSERFTPGYVTRFWWCGKSSRRLSRLPPTGACVLEIAYIVPAVLHSGKSYVGDGSNLILPMATWINC